MSVIASRDNLRVRRQLRTVEQITGRIIVTPDGNEQCVQLRPKGFPRLQ